MKLKAKIRGSKVHDVGYRVFLLDMALELGIDKFAAYNRIEDGSQIVSVLVEGEEDQVAQFRVFVEENRPVNAEVSEVDLEDYDGRIVSTTDFLHLIQIQQLNKGIPALLRIEGTQEKMLENQCQMLDKQDTSTGVLKDIKKDTSNIGAIRKDVSSIRDEARQDREDLISALKSGRLEEKYEQLSQEIAEIKAAIAEIRAKVS